MKKNKEKKKEVWEVVISCEEYHGENRTYRVFAVSACDAEVKGIALFKKEDEEFLDMKVFCLSARFLFCIDS